MSQSLSVAADPCGPTTGTVVGSPVIPNFDPLSERSRATWTSGDFGRIALAYTDGAAAFVERLALARGEKVLDVACGTGNLAVPAARRGAVVTGVDIAPNLIENARRIAGEASLDIRYDVGNAEALPYADESFDTVISMFGVMFAARPEVALAELLRVTKSGGRIALANWEPAGFIGAMFRTHGEFVPPPAGSASPLGWGDENVMRARLGAHADRAGSVRFVPRTIALSFEQLPAGVVEYFREFYGPSVRTFGALDAQSRAELTAKLTALWAGRNEAGPTATLVEAEYVEVLIDVA